jgi:hypothetical protein
MALRQTYESHLVGVGEPMTGDKLTGSGIFNDSVRWLPFAQGMAYSYAPQIEFHQGIGGQYNTLDMFTVLRDTDISVTIRQLDHVLPTGTGYGSIFQDINLINRNSNLSSQNVYDSVYPEADEDPTGDGAAIYFVTDTGQIGRNQIDVPTGNTGYARQMTVFDPCYINSISWSCGVGQPAIWEYNFVGSYASVTSQTKGNDTWDWNLRRPRQSGVETTGRITFDPIQDPSGLLNLSGVEGLIVHHNMGLDAAGYPDFGELRGASMRVNFPRQPITPMGHEQPIHRQAVGKPTVEIQLEYNYEGREFDNASFRNNTTYSPVIRCTGFNGNSRAMFAPSCKISNVQVNADVGGNPDSVTVSLIGGGGALSMFYTFV